MAREEELKRIDLKVNVSCCDGCRRKVMKAMSLKGVLRTEIQPSHDRVTVVGDVDVKVLMKKLAKVGKIAELLPPAPAASEQGKKQRDEGEWKDGGDKPAPAQAAEEKCKGKDDGMGAGDKAAAKVAPSKHDGCKKCAREAAARGMPGGDNGDHGSVKKQAPSSKDAAGGGGEEGCDADGLFGAKPLAAAAADHHHAQAPQPQAHYHRAEPAMVVPAYYPPPPAAAAVPYYGYYGMPPPPPLTMMPMAPPAQRHPQLRPQPSRFDENYFDDDNTVGCSVM